jgi:hypothetical protein
LSFATSFVPSPTGYQLLYGLPSHSQKQPVVLSYTISNQNIFLKDRDTEQATQQLRYPGLQVGIAKACTHALSLMSVDGILMVETDINYQPSQEPGVLVCIQQVENPGCMVFSAADHFALNCSPKITDILFIQNHIPFSFKYADRTKVKRVDIFIEQQEAERLLNPALLNKIDIHDMITMKADSSNKTIEELLDSIGKKITGQHLCKYLHELIICMNEIGKWKSRF